VSPIEVYLSDAHALGRRLSEAAICWEQQDRVNIELVVPRISHYSGPPCQVQKSVPAKIQTSFQLSVGKGKRDLLERSSSLHQNEPYRVFTDIPLDLLCEAGPAPVL
jgi:hypothetical protein